MLIDLLVGVLAAAPVAILVGRSGRVTRAGVAAGLVIAAVIYAAFQLAGLAVLGTALSLTLAASRVAATRRHTDGGASGEERRGARNITANCLVGTLAAAAHLAFELRLDTSALWFVAGIAAGASDTVASEIGAAFGGRPRTPLSWRRVAPGTPGAISVTGTLAGIAAAAAIAAPAPALWLTGWDALLAVVVGATAGSLVESVLASTLEARHLIGNHTLNLVNTAVAAGVTVGWAARF